MNQLETNLTLWAICAILVLEILIITWLCRCFANRIKPKRFYVKREEYEYLQGSGGTPSQFQSTILRPPHADELALVGTIRAPNSHLTYDSGIQNFGFYRDDDEEIIPSLRSPVPLLPPPPLPPPVQNLNWIELRPSTSGAMINTAQLPPADYEIHPYPSDDYLYTHAVPPPRSAIIDFHPYREEYDDINDDDDQDDELENFRFQSLRRPEITLPLPVQRTDTSTESYGGNYATLVPKSILKGSTSTTPPLDLFSTPFLPPITTIPRSRTSSKYDESPRISVKVNTDESIPIDHPISAIASRIPSQPILSSLPLSRMRFASVSQLNEIEWEVPREFQTIVYELSDNGQQSSIRGALIYNSNDNFNNNNNNNTYDDSFLSQSKISNRQRSRSSDIDERTHVSRVFVPWERQIKLVQSSYLSNSIEQNDPTQQQQAFEY